VGIVVSVSDGLLSASLAPFSISVIPATSGAATVTWDPPTQNVDGSTVTNLKGYRVRYGTSSSNLNNVLDIANVGVTSAVIDSLTAGTWYFAVTAYNTVGAESDLSEVKSKTIP
jgi:hypothetical protein